jgi:hypothetical protein
MEDVMRFPSINDVAAELRVINKNTLEPDDADEGIDVRLQVYLDSRWEIRGGASDYDQDHHGYWGASSVPGNNRRFDSKDVARDLIEQAREHKATGGDDGVSEHRVAAGVEEDDEDENEDDEEGDEEDSEPDDDAFSDEEMQSGYVISDARRGGYDVVHEHKHVGHYKDMDEALDAIDEEMERSKFFPNVYYVNDHGNVDLLDGDGNVIESRT